MWYFYLTWFWSVFWHTHLLQSHSTLRREIKTWCLISLTHKCLSHTCAGFQMHLGAFVINTNSSESITESMTLLIIPLFSQRINTKSMITICRLRPPLTIFKLWCLRTLMQTAVCQGSQSTFWIPRGPGGTQRILE